MILLEQIEGEYTMGTWGARIFDDDGAADIYAEYRILLGYKVEPEKAWQLIYDYFYPDYKESDNEDAFWLSVALFQWQNGILKEEVKQKAIQCIDNESYLEVWKESDPAAYKKRRVVLAQLKEKLINEVNPPRKVAKCPPYYREKTQFRTGDIYSYIHENGNISYVEVVRIRKEPVTKLAPELDYQSTADFALIDVWSPKRYTLEELSKLPYRKFCEVNVQNPIQTYAYDTVSVHDEDTIRKNMDYLGRVSRVWTKESAFFCKGGIEPFPRVYTQVIESTFSLPYGITNEMLNEALAEFLIDSTIETLEHRLSVKNPQLSKSVCIALKLVLIRCISRLAGDIRRNHITKIKGATDNDIKDLVGLFSWSNEENTRELADKFIPVDANAIGTDFGLKIDRAVDLYYGFPTIPHN